jgi:hypothetical protein
MPAHSCNKQTFSLTQGLKHKIRYIKQGGYSLSENAKCSMGHVYFPDEAKYPVPKETQKKPQRRL